MENINDVVKAGLCIGCGICTYFDPPGKMVFNKKLDQKIPINNISHNEKFVFEICPGKGYNILEESKSLFNEAKYDLELGYIYNHYAACSTDKELLKNASSGGLMSAIAIYLLENKIVDRVLTTQFKFDSGVNTDCILAKDKADILKSQGSKYCPVDLSKAINEIKNNKYNVAIIGTPCQLAGIRNIQRLDKEFSRKVIFTIGNFCGGIKTFKNINLLAKRNGINPNDIDYFRFRGNGQPGSMLIKEISGKQVEIPYPNYVGLNGLSKHLRCHLCIDATGELADFSCGDAWLDKFLKHINPWSVLITRNKKADDIIKRMIDTDLIVTLPISTEEIKKSQHENITSKKVRQKSRFYLYKTFGFRLPNFDGGYYDNNIRIWIEIKVFTKHRIKLLLEQLHLFKLVYNLIK
ncbi:MAG TPA: Coenzyme F420 hydrogenase/dehydrogenase, beta subunit C-terminal domain [Ignavibacteriaceae bacterium]|nr:Coenzyme F420 hydrogenase/dehydrogenase, beta subunit C-terminal domain [Ignavibacteriaceae bacterium]